MTATLLPHAPAPAPTDPPDCTHATISTGLVEALCIGSAHADATGILVPAHDQMVAEGLFHLLVPPELGGAGASITEWFDTALDIARIDASAGWLMAQGAAQAAWIAVAGSAELVAEFFTTRQTLASTSAAIIPAEQHGNHYRLRNARWPYVSGSPGAAYLGGLIASVGTDGTPVTRMAIVPADHATIEPTWDTLGLRGTASHHLDFGDRIDVAATHTITWPMLTIERPGTLATAVGFVGWMISLSAAATNLGAARHAIDAAVAAAVTKRHRFDTVPVAEQPTFLRGVAGLHGTVDLAVAGLRSLLDDLWFHAVAGIEPTPEVRARLRLAAASAVHLSAGVVRAARGLIGADALHRTSALERIGRDSEMLLHHVSVNPSTQEQLAQVLHGTYQGPRALI